MQSWKCHVMWKRGLTYYVWALHMLQKVHLDIWNQWKLRSVWLSIKTLLGCMEAQEHLNFRISPMSEGPFYWDGHGYQLGWIKVLGLIDISRLSLTHFILGTPKGLLAKSAWQLDCASWSESLLVACRQSIISLNWANNTIKVEIITFA